jgi:hypothetical protein
MSPEVWTIGEARQRAESRGCQVCDDPSNGGGHQHTIVGVLLSLGTAGRCRPAQGVGDRHVDLGPASCNPDGRFVRVYPRRTRSGRGEGGANVA